MNVAEQSVCSRGKGVNRERLRDMCKAYRLPHSGNMDALREKLRRFSQQRDLWDQ